MQHTPEPAVPSVDAGAAGLNINVPPREPNVMRVGAPARVAAAVNAMQTIIKNVPGRAVRTALNNGLLTVVTEMLHMQSNINAHKRALRDAIEIMKMVDRPGAFTSEGGDLRLAMIRAWAADVRGVIAGETASHDGPEIAQEAAHPPQHDDYPLHAVPGVVTQASASAGWVSPAEAVA